MGEHRHGGRQGPGLGFRPPWWPEGEPFPPHGPEAWRGMRRHFVRRAFLFLAAVFVLLVGASALAVTLFSGLGDRPGAAAIVGAAFLALAVSVLFRTVRRFAAPIGEVMEAADRVAAGDYSVRLEAQGPRDVRRLGRAFNEMTERLRTSEERRRELLADVTHELRTPLSVIRANLEGVLDGVYAPDEAQLRRLLEETRVMERLLDDLRTLSTAEAGALRLHPEPVAPAELVEEAVASFGTRAVEAGVALSSRAEPRLPSITIDRVRIGEVLANLLSNALRHTPRGGSVVIVAKPAGDGTVAFEVVDTGSGIPEDELLHVFERFARSADSSGLGLGLAIAKSLVLAHGGQIGMESPPGRGTKVWFTLPAQR